MSHGYDNTHACCVTRRFVLEHLAKLLMHAATYTLPLRMLWLRAGYASAITCLLARACLTYLTQADDVRHVNGIRLI